MNSFLLAAILTGTSTADIQRVWSCHYFESSPTTEHAARLQGPVIIKPPGTSGSGVCVASVECDVFEKGAHGHREKWQTLVACLPSAGFCPSATDCLRQNRGLISKPDGVVGMKASKP